MNSKKDEIPQPIGLRDDQSQNNKRNFPTGQKIPYEKQIFVCTNDRKGEKPSCGDQKGEKIFTELRRIAKERGFHPRIRVAQAKCLGQCNLGCNIMVYPNGIWYKGVTLADVQTFADQHLI